MGVFLSVIVGSMSMEEVHQGTEEDEEERCVSKNMLPMVKKRNNHHSRKEVVEPVGYAEVLHA